MFLAFENCLVRCRVGIIVRHARCRGYIFFIDFHLLFIFRFCSYRFIRFVFLALLSFSGKFHSTTIIIAIIDGIPFFFSLSFSPWFLTATAIRNNTENRPRKPICVFYRRVSKIRPNPKRSDVATQRRRQRSNFEHISRPA